MNATLLSEFEHLQRERPDLTDSELVRMLAAQTVRDLDLAPPVDPSLVASYRGIARIEEVDLPWAGCLVHEGGETVAKVRAADGRCRRRFSALHEVKHTYLPGFALTQYRGCEPTPLFPSELPTGNRLEVLADVGASELLFPRDAFTADLDGNRVDLDLIGALAERYDASLEATAIRAVDLSTTPTALIKLEIATKPSEPDAEPVLRVCWSRTAGAWPHIPRYKSAPDGGHLHRALHGELVDEVGNLTGLTRGPLLDVQISSRLLAYTRPDGSQCRRVLALLTPTKGRWCAA